MNKPIENEYINSITPYIPGDFAIGNFNKVVKLSSNENLLGPSKNAINAYLDCHKKLHIYPDSNCLDLKKALAYHYNIDPTRIICEAGSEPIINLITKVFCNIKDEVLYSQYGYIAYKIAAESVGAKPISCEEVNYTTSIENILKNITNKTRIIFIANPNNPTGTKITISQIKYLLSKIPKNILLVIDEAYAEYNTDANYQTALKLVNSGAENVIVLHTFSKIYGLGALRVGWGYASSHIINTLDKLRGVFTVSTPAQAAAEAAIQDNYHIQKSIEHNNKWRTYLLREFQKLKINCLPSYGNFICVDFQTPKMVEEVDTLLRSNAIIPRTLKEYNLDQFLRITIGLPEDCQKVVQLIASIINNENY